jgi:hypothetical protein
MRRLELRATLSGEDGSSLPCKIVGRKVEKQDRGWRSLRRPGQARRDRSGNGCDTVRSAAYLGQASVCSGVTRSTSQSSSLHHPPRSSARRRRCCQRFTSGHTAVARPGFDHLIHNVPAAAVDYDAAERGLGLTPTTDPACTQGCGCGLPQREHLLADLCHEHGCLIDGSASSSIRSPISSDRRPALAMIHEPRHPPPGARAHPRFEQVGVARSDRGDDSGKPSFPSDWLSRSRRNRRTCVAP